MHKAIHQPQPWCHPLAPKPTFNIFIACEDQSALLQAWRVRDQVESLCGQEANVSSVYWSFALFRNEQLRARAAVEAAEADMVVVAFGGGDELPPHVRAWVETWPARPQPGHAVLVALVCAGQETRMQSQRRVQLFRQVAAERGLDFLCNHDDWDRVEPFSPVAPISGVLQEGHQSTLSDELEWSTGGINE
jgi:hypothetical protein